MEFDAIQVARLALACLDLTRLGDHDDEAGVISLCERAAGPFGTVAAVCVWPRFVGLARRHVPAGVRVAAVANFPHGGEDARTTGDEVRHIVAEGAHEVDLVMPWRAVLTGQQGRAAAVLRAARAASPGRCLKVIVESGELHTPAAILTSARLAIAEGADFLKTSTGRAPVGATPAAVQVMLQAIAEDRSAASRVGIKISGGVRTVDDATPYLTLVREALGTPALQPQRLRIGASALLADIEAVLRRDADAAGNASPHPAGRPR